MPKTRPRPDFERLLPAIYEAAVEPTRWPVVLTAISDHLGAMGGMVVRQEPTPTGGMIFVGRLDPDLTDLYMRRYTDNAYARALARIEPGHPVLGGAIVDAAAVRRTAFHADILAPQGVREQLAFSYGPWCRAPGASGGVSFQLGARVADAPGETVRRMERLTPHLHRALDIGHAIAARSVTGAALAGFLDGLPDAAFTLDAAGRVLRANAAGEAMLGAADGLVLSGGRLGAGHADDDRALLAAIAGAVATARAKGEEPGARLRVARPSGRSALILLVSPLPPACVLFSGADRPAVLVVAHDPEAPADAEALRDAFGLTAAEARLAVLIGSGAGLPDAAARLGVSRETARTHLARCFDKTGARSQAALARLSAAVPRRVWGPETSGGPL
ncbi:helix-turn-helix transcriptional regulator [Roseomonas sp. CCTCC AB2023176]|uniref:helix-turn-helix transcriptional regulator n=1 Tax=Roseomonas sp. CCTCC AB2023176 TaxID=3342640 RepID=UPI0035D5DBD0